MTDGPKRKPRAAKPGDATEKLRKAALAEIEQRIDEAVVGNGHIPEVVAENKGRPAKAKPKAPVVPPKPNAKDKPKRGADRPATPAPEKSPKAEKAAKADKPKRLGALDAAAQVLAASDRPMRATEIVAAMARQGLWKSPGGKTPESTVYAGIVREIARKGPQSRFRKIERGLFGFNTKGA